MNKAFIYCRVSTPGQLKNTSLEAQLDKCRSAASHYNLEVVDECAVCESGSLLAQRTLQQLVMRMLAGDANVLIYPQMDRLSRDPKVFTALQRLVKGIGGRLINADLLADDSTDAVFISIINSIRNRD